MNTSMRRVALAAALVAVPTLGGAARHAPDPDSAPAVQRLTISTPWDGGTFHYIDVGKKDVGPGDMFTVVGAPVTDEGTGDRIGGVDVLETVLSARHDGTVSWLWTFRLDGGTVNAVGILRHTDKPIRLPIVGGTGDYLGVSGQLREIREDRDRRVSITRLVLLHRGG